MNKNEVFVGKEGWNNLAERAARERGFFGKLDEGPTPKSKDDGSEAEKESSQPKERYFPE